MSKTRTNAISIALLTALLCMAALISCSKKEVSGPARPTGTATSSDTVNLTLRPIIASTDLALGINRFVFAILDENSSPIKEPEVNASFLYLGGSAPQVKTTTPARFHQWPTSQGGVYVTQTDFDIEGQWGIEVSLKDNTTQTKFGRGLFQVKKKSSTPPLGSPAIRSNNKTIKDVQSLAQLTSDPNPDPELYELTISKAVTTGKPTLIAFATPAFCTSATCGPQLDVIKELKAKYQGSANFIHIEIYSNPDEMKGDLSKGQISETALEWSLTSEPWTFIIDKDGKVAYKFEGFTSTEELEQALLQTTG